MGETASPYLLALLQPKQLWVRGLIHIQVFARGLAQHLSGLGAVQDVVHNLSVWQIIQEGAHECMAHPRVGA